ncbi:MAG: pyruvate, phosphate dikinase [Myxococcota bacterium]|nr:pyruvate, phosphate dikinase [Myxococcota bacterium]MDW8362944.1 pyruvate, phosphate dikinase [Myxococcales bacterium]
MIRLVYDFGDPLPQGTEERALLGGKGAGLAQMVRLGLPVPPGFTITTEACRHVRAASGRWPDGLWDEVLAALGRLEQRTGRRFGAGPSPLLLSVRSGARASMPGMMDTVLNLGLSEPCVEHLARESSNRRFALDARRRFIEMYADVVMGVAREHFERALADRKAALGRPSMADAELPASALEDLVRVYLDIVRAHARRPLPEDPLEQLRGAIDAVFASWDNPRAVRYRRMHGLPDDWGTAVNVQAMVFGNLGDDSGSGVAFTRNPSTGEPHLYGEYLPDAQGEDVVAGIRTPRPLAAAAAAPGREHESLERAMPAAYAELQRLAQALERHFRDVQDIEFTIERGKLYLLQTRAAKRTARAAVRIAVDLVREGLRSPQQAIEIVDAAALEQLLHARLPDPDTLATRGVRPIAIGLPASPGAAVGRIVLDADEAERRAAEGIDVVLVRRETSPEDIHGMKAARGILTATGGMTSHAAVVARGLGKCCVAGCATLHVDYEARTVTARTDAGQTVVLRPGDVVSLDGTTGRVYAGEVPVEAAASLPELDELMRWADASRRLKVYANADTPRQARMARSLGAEGIGLCRTEHMFFSEERVLAVRCMVLAPTDAARAHWLERIEPVQREDFAGILEAMDGLPVVIRLLDWPLHEFLPREERELEAVASALGSRAEGVRATARSLEEINPMLGHRGVRLGLTHPEIYRMQVRAIARAAAALRRRGLDPRPHIMLPVVALGTELRAAREIVVDQLEAVWREEGIRLEVPIGTMIELPRACLAAAELAPHADFFSFGTNDLTQTTLGISRDDAGRFLPAYLGALRLLTVDPFVRLDETGVGELVRIALDRGKSARPSLVAGLCGEHGGEPGSIDFCERARLDYVSCSPPRLPVARLAAAQAALRAGAGTSPQA